MMGIFKFLTIRMHWETHELWLSGLIKDTMSRDKLKYK